MAGQFAIDMAAFGARSKTQMRNVVRWVSLEMLRRIVMRSPVDTGRFRANWQVDLNTPPEEVTVDVDVDGQITVMAGELKLAGYELGGTVFIVNNLPYAIPLEEGHSKQAPAGMVGVTLTEFPGVVETSASAVR